MQIFNARTQEIEDAEMSVDDNNEIVATFADGGFVKFPAGLSEKDFEELIGLHQEHNEGQEVITPEMEAETARLRAASQALIGGEPDAPSNDDED